MRELKCPPLGNKRMQRSGTEAIRTQLQPSKPKREITNITNSQNTKISYGQLSEQLLAHEAETLVSEQR